MQLKITKYIPVLAATFGLTPSARSDGLQIEAPPSPSAPATQPPPNPMQINLTKLLP